MDGKIRVGGGIRLSWQEGQRLKPLKELDLQQCEFCQRINLLNLGWLPWKQVGCQFHQKEHVLCHKLCRKVARRIVGCELYEIGKEIKEIVVKPNRAYDWCACYGCGKELKGAGKTGKVKNRNNPSFWGIESKFKILCLECIGKKFYRRMEDWQRKKFREYARRGYV